MAIGDTFYGNFHSPSQRFFTQAGDPLIFSHKQGIEPILEANMLVGPLEKRRIFKPEPSFPQIWPFSRFWPHLTEPAGRACLREAVNIAKSSSYPIILVVYNDWFLDYGATYDVEFYDIAPNPLLPL